MKSTLNSIIHVPCWDKGHSDKHLYHINTVTPDYISVNNSHPITANHGALKALTSGRVLLLLVLLRHKGTASAMAAGSAIAPFPTSPQASALLSYARSHKAFPHRAELLAEHTLQVNAAWLVGTKAESCVPRLGPLAYVTHDNDPC